MLVEKFPMKNNLSLLVLAGWSASLTICRAHAAPAPSNVDWSTYLGDKSRSHYSTLDQINRSNVTQLKVAWTYETGDKGEYQANNLIIGGTLFTASPTRKVIALDGAPGKEIWRWDP